MPSKYDEVMVHPSHPCAASVRAGGAARRRGVRAHHEHDRDADGLDDAAFDEDGRGVGGVDSYLARLDHVVREVPAVDGIVDFEGDAVAGEAAVLDVVDPALWYFPG